MRDERFRYIDGDFVVRRLFTGARKTEGPAWFAAARYLVFSDIPNDRLMRWDETTGAVGVFREPSGYANGNTIDRQGRLIMCEQGNRRVTRTEHDGDGAVSRFADDFCRPNGLAFSLDERQLYIVDMRREPSRIRVFDVAPDGRLTGGHIFAECDHGRFDGIRLDEAGRVWAAAWDGVHCFGLAGTLLGKRTVPPVAPNARYAARVFRCLSAVAAIPD